MPLRHVLAVDDDPDALELLRGFLEDTGHQLEFATSGREALRKLDWRSYDVVLADYRMPGMDGYVFAHEAKARHPALPIVLMTGATLRRTSRDITYFLYKPFGVQELRNLLSVLECLVPRDRRHRLRRQAGKEARTLLTRTLQSMQTYLDSETSRRASYYLQVVNTRFSTFRS
jgi:CheY-like chemotaxis protein